jgi:hypothetical protein
MQPRFFVMLQSKPFKLSLLLSVFLTLFACSNTPEVKSQFSTYFKFNAAHKYSMYKRDSELYQTQNIADGYRNVVELILEDAIAKQKLTYTSLNKADIIFSYHLLDDDKQALARYNQFVHLCVQCGIKNRVEVQKQKNELAFQRNRTQQQKSGRNNRGQQPAKRKTHNESFLPLAIIIDAIDPKTNGSVWRVQQPLNLKAKDNSLEVQKKIAEAIQLGFSSYPSNIVAK